MSLLRRYEVVCLIVGGAVLGCERPSTGPQTDAVLAAADEGATPSRSESDGVQPDPIEELNTKLESMGAKVVAENSFHEDLSDDEKYETLAREVKDLRSEVKRLRETVDLTVSYVVGDLQEENRRLRQEVARAYGVDPDGSEDQPDAMDQMASDFTERASAAPHLPAPDRGPAESEYVVVKEWGRPPEEVESLGLDVPSLKGMICVAPDNLSDGAYSDLGRQILDEFDDYDNILIEVFTSEAAAKAYAEKNKRSTAHNVLTIQKDGASGSDNVLLHRNGVSVDVPH